MLPILKFGVLTSLALRPSPRRFGAPAALLVGTRITKPSAMCARRGRVRRSEGPDLRNLGYARRYGHDAGTPRPSAKRPRELTKTAAAGARGPVVMLSGAGFVAQTAPETYFLDHRLRNGHSLGSPPGSVRSRTLTAMLAASSDARGLWPSAATAVRSRFPSPSFDGGVGELPSPGVNASPGPRRRNPRQSSAPVIDGETVLRLER